MLRSLYEQCKLFEGQDEEWESIDAFSEFVTGWVEVRWDMVKMEEEEQEAPKPRRITPSA